MATEGTGNTSFRQYEFCKLCKINHKRKKKHIYSKRHQDILTNILKKFESKIAAAKKTVFNPEVEDIAYEDNARFWCYFCEEEFEKHKRMDQCTIKYGSLLQHICGEEHVSKCVDFLWDNIIKVKNKDKYIISKEHYESFKLAAVKAVISFEEAQKEKHLKEVTKIQQKEKLQRKTLLDGERQSSSLKSLRNIPEGYGGVNAYPQTERTILYGFGESQYETMDRGNEVNSYPGIATEWTRDDCQEQTKTEIGPSMADYQRYLQRKKKKNVPSAVDEECLMDEELSGKEWSPSIGQRFDSEKLYAVSPHDGLSVTVNEQHQTINHKKGQRSEPTSSASFVSANTDSFKCVPYKRKHSATSTLSKSEYITPTVLHTPIVEAKTRKAEFPSCSSLITNTEMDSITCLPYKKTKQDMVAKSRSEFIVPTILQTPFVEPSHIKPSNEATNSRYETFRHAPDDKPQTKYPKFDKFY